MKSLQSNVSLIRFNMENNSIGDKAADDIATILSKNNMIQIFSVSRNDIQTQGMIKIAKALQHNLSLIHSM